MNQCRFKFLGQKFSVVSEKDYNQMLRQIISLSKEKYKFKIKTPLFNQEIKLIKAKKHLSEPTLWGGVNLKKVDVGKDYIKKLLVIRKYGILGYEYHKKKIERLKILEGYCLVNFKLAKPGNRFKYAPGREHGVIALTNCVIEEQSTNDLDDLIFIFNSKQVI